jgi:hypothetical protein
MAPALGLLRRQLSGWGWQTLSSCLRQGEQDEVVAVSEMAAVTKRIGFVTWPEEAYNYNPVYPHKNRWQSSPPVAFQMDILRNMSRLRRRKAYPGFWVESPSKPASQRSPMCMCACRPNSIWFL